MEISQEEYNALKIKADKWDKLDVQISNFYLQDMGEFDENDSEGDLSTIGELAAMAFGYL